MACRKDSDGVKLLNDITSEWMKRIDGLNLIPKELNSRRELIVNRDDFNSVALDAEVSPGEINVIALILDLYKLSDEFISIDSLTHLKRNGLVQILFWGP